MPEVINSALGLAQYISGCMSEEQAIAYLLAVESISLQDWKAGKQLLANADPTNRQNREGTIKDIVKCFQNDPTVDSYIVKDLSILPGLSKPALELVSYHLSTLYAITTITRRHIETEEERPLLHKSSRLSNHAQELDNNTQPEVTSTASKQTAVAHGTQVAHGTVRETPTQERDSRPPPPGWSTVERRPYKRRDLSKSRKQLVQGTSKSEVTGINHPRKFVCLGVRSGPNETNVSLESELKKWNCLTDLKIEKVRETYHSSMFRVQFNIPISVQNKWREPASWPARMVVSEWRGDPKKALQPLVERVYQKRIYIGKLSEQLTTEQLTNNLKHIYQSEIQTETIHKVEVHWNEVGNKRSEQLQNQDPTIDAYKSACIVLISHPGKTLENVDLKLEHYSPRIRRTVRHWNGRTPSTVAPAMSPDLDW